MRRKLIRILIVLIALFLLAGLAVKLFISPEAVKNFVFAELEARTGIHAEAEEASIQFPWPVGLRLKQLELSTPEDGEAAYRLEARVEEALATADLMSLIRKEPQVQEVRLRAPQLELWLSEPPPPTTGTSGETQTVAPPSGDTAGLALALSLLSIEDGRLVLHRPDGSTTTVDGLQQKVRFQIDASQEFSGRLETELSALRMQGGSRETPLELGALSAEVLVSGRLEPLRIEAQIAGFSGEGLDAEGDVLYEIRGDRPFLEAGIDWGMDPVALLRRVREAGAEDGKDPLEGIELSLDSVSGRVDWRGFLPEETDDPAVWLPGLSLTGAVEGVELGAFRQAELLRAGARFHLEGEQIILDPVELQAEGLQMQGRLATPALGSGELTGHFSLQLDTAAAEERLQTLWPTLPESLTAASAPPEEWPRLAGGMSGELELQIPLPPPDELPAHAARGTLRPAEITLVHPSMVAPLVVKKGSIAFDLEQATLEGMRFSTDGLEGTVEGVVDGWPEKKRFVGRGAFALLDLDRLRPESEGAQSRGPTERAHWWAPAPAHAAAQAEPFVPPQNLEVQMAVEVDQLLTRGYRIRELSCTADLEERELQLKDLRGKLGEGRLMGEASVDWKAEQPTWKTRIQAVEIPARDLLDPVAPRLADALATKLNGMILLEADLSEDRAQILQSLTGGGALKGTAGELLTTVLLGDGLSSLPGNAAQKLSVVPFKDFLTSLRFDAGRAHFSETVLRGSTQVRAEGWAGFDGQVDYALEVKLPVGEKLDLGAFTPLVEFLRASDDRITIPIHVTGAAKKPKIALELDAAEKRAKDAAKDDLEDKVKGLLKGLGGKKGGG